MIPTSLQAYKPTSLQAYIVLTGTLLFSACNPLGSSSIEDGFLEVAGGGGAVSSGGSCTAGTATASDALAGVTFPDGSGGMTTGTMTNVGAFNLTGAFSAGYVSSLTGLAASSVCSTTSLLGSAGTATCVTGTPDAVVGNVLTGKTFWNAAGAPVTGTMTNQGSWSLSGASALAAPAFPGAGYYSGITNAPATTNYCAGTYINGSNGTALCAGGATTGTTIAAAQVCSGYSGYNLAGTAVNGSLTCSLSDTPSTVSAGPIVWLKADKLLGLSSTPSNGASVSVWHDSSENNRSAIATSSALQPTFQTNVINSLPVVRFAGSSGLTIYSSSLSGESHTIIILFKLSSIVPAVTGVIGYGGTTDQGGYFILSSGKSAWYLPKNAGGFWNYDATGSVTFDTTSFQVISLVHSASSSLTAYRNKTTTDATTAINTAATLNGSLLIGNQAVASRNMNGDIAEILIYSSALSDTDRNTVECYLSTKYNLSLTGC